ncbi:hypothetical protein B0H14DRAFT_2756888, partial [Mycena olivaceomarginata]
IGSPQTECNMPCTGDASATCGGGFRLSVYTVPVVAKRTVRPENSSQLQEADVSSRSRTLLRRFMRKPIPPLPQLHIFHKDHPRMHRRCFCGNELGGTASLSTPGSGLAIPQTECNMPCAGDAGTIRGGGSRLSLYTVPALARRGDGSTLRRSLERRTFPNPTSNVGPISTTPTATANPTPSATCYVDSCDKPSLPFLGSKKATQTVSGCIAECGAPGDECFCGNDLGSTAALNVPGSGLAIPQTECNMSSFGICGGGFRLSVYTVPASTIKKRTARSNVRCSLEKRTCPGAPAPSPKSPLQTVPRCIAECAATNYKLAGLSWPNECFWGNELAGTAALTTPGSGLALPRTESNMPCAGDGGIICGGGFRLRLYTVPAQARRNYRPNFRRSLQKRTCPSSTSTLIGNPTVSGTWRR